MALLYPKQPGFVYRMDIRKIWEIAISQTTSFVKFKNLIHRQLIENNLFVYTERCYWEDEPDKYRHEGYMTILQVKEELLTPANLRIAEKQGLIDKYILLGDELKYLPNPNTEARLINRAVSKYKITKPFFVDTREECLGCLEDIDTIKEVEVLLSVSKFLDKEHYEIEYLWKHGIIGFLYAQYKFYEKQYDKETYIDRRIINSVWTNPEEYKHLIQRLRDVH